MKINSRQLGEGAPVLLIHGFCETLEIWDGFDKKLSESARVISIDLPGFGKSPLPEKPFSIKSIAESVLSWLLQICPEPVTVIGHSLGGYVALAMASIDPVYCKKLVLFHSSVFADTPEKQVNRNKVIEFVEKNGVEPFLQTFVPSLFFNKAHPEIERVKRICRKTTSETLIAYTEAMRDRHSQEEFVRDYENPILIIAGEKDEVIPLEISQKMVSLNPQISLLRVPEAGHKGMVESPIMILSAIKKFL